MEQRFRRAPFPLYGLPPSWEGGRFLGGGSWGSALGRDRINSLSLVHGALVEGQGPILVVESAWPGQPSGGNSLRVLAESLWSGRARDVVEARDQFSRRRHLPERDLLDPLPSRAETTVSVDGESVPLDVLAQPHRWVGRARLEGCDVTIQGLEWDIEGVILAQVRDLTPYILGSRRFEGAGT